VVSLLKVAPSNRVIVPLKVAPSNQVFVPLKVALTSPCSTTSS